MSGYISNYDTSKFNAVFDALLLQALEHPIRFKMTNDRYIQAAHRYMHMAKVICVFDPFAQFVYALMNELNNKKLKVLLDSLPVTAHR